MNRRTAILAADVAGYSPDEGAVQGSRHVRTHHFREDGR
jgi:hypothetical protein